MRIPDDFEIKSKFIINRRRLYVLSFLGLLIGVLFFRLFSTLRNFDLLLFLEKFNSPFMLVTLLMALLFFVYIHGYIHEKIHQYFFRIYGVRTEIHMNLFVPNNTLSIGEVCVRNGAIYATLSPLIILEIFGLLLFVFIPTNSFSPYIILFLSANIAMATADMAEFVWLLRHPKEYLFGFDGKDSVMYGQKPLGKSRYN